MHTSFPQSSLRSALRRTLTAYCLGVVVIAVIGRPAIAEERLETKGVGLRPSQLFSPLTADAPRGNIGIFVGVNRFTHDQGVNQLNYAVHDAIETAYLFVVELKLIPASNCRLLLSGLPTSDPVRAHLEQLRQTGARVLAADRSNILKALVQVTNAEQQEDNLLVCAISSHGFEEHGDAYVLPSDGIRQILAETAVPLKTIDNLLHGSKAGHKLLLVDACHERISAKGGEDAGKPTSEAFVTALKSPSGQAKLASCSPGERSFEHASLGGVGHGVFTYAFLQALRGGAKADAGNVIRLGEVADFVAADVAMWCKDLDRPSQSPFLESPVATRRLPLACKADDLQALAAGLQKVALRDGWTEELRGALTERLPLLMLERESDRKLVVFSRDFVDGKLPPEVFVPYLEKERQRWATEIAIRLCNWSETESLIQSQKGKVVVLEFWATSCPPCYQSVPKLFALQQKFGKDVVCITVNVDYWGRKSKPPEYYQEKVLSFLRSKKSNAVNLLCTEASDVLFEKLDIPHYPRVFIYDRRGKRVADLPKEEDDEEGLSYEDVNSVVSKLVAESSGVRVPEKVE